MWLTFLFLAGSGGSWMDRNYEKLYIEFNWLSSRLRNNTEKSSKLEAKWSSVYLNKENQNPEQKLEKMENISNVIYVAKLYGSSAYLLTSELILVKNLINAHSVDRHLHKKGLWRATIISVHTGKKPHECTQCGKRFALKRNLSSHITSVHTEEKPHECTQCGHRFAQKGSLSSHIASVHIWEKPHQCTQCGQRFTLKGSLSSHIISVHTGEKPHECTQCGQEFALKGNLKRHITSIHSGEKPHQCKQCGQRFRQKVNLSRHITSIHTGKKPHQCTQCGKRFAQKGNLSSHIASVNTGEKPHECTQCGKRFAHKGTLSRHITSVHTGERPNECTQCGQRFTQKWSLNSHIISVHTGEKPHECTHCWQRFALKGNLSRHITSVHSGGKAHERTDCGQTFTQRKGTLREELWTVHITLVHEAEKPHKYSVWQSICTLFKLVLNMRAHRRETPWDALTMDKNLTKDVLSFGLLDIHVIITKAFGFPKPSLSSNYKVMLLLCHRRVNWIQNITVRCARFPEFCANSRPPWLSFS